MARPRRLTIPRSVNHLISTDRVVGPRGPLRPHVETEAYMEPRPRVEVVARSTHGLRRRRSRWGPLDYSQMCRDVQRDLSEFNDSLKHGSAQAVNTSCAPASAGVAGGACGSACFRLRLLMRQKSLFATLSGPLACATIFQSSGVWDPSPSNASKYLQLPTDATDGLSYMVLHDREGKGSMMVCWGAWLCLIIQLDKSSSWSRLGLEVFVIISKLLRQNAACQC